MARSSKGPSRHPAGPALPLAPPQGGVEGTLAPPRWPRTTRCPRPFLMAPPPGRGQAYRERAAGWVFAYKGGHARGSAGLVAASAPQISGVEPPAELLSQPSRSRGRGPQPLGEAGPGGAGRGPQGRVGGMQPGCNGRGRGDASPPGSPDRTRSPAVLPGQEIRGGRRRTGPGARRPREHPSGLLLQG